MFQWFQRKKRMILSDKAEEKEKIPYEQQNEISSMVMLVTIINRNQSHYYIEAYEKAGASMTLVLYSYSMPPDQYRNILGPDSTKKEILLTFCREEDVQKMLDIAKARFQISRAAKGIAFTCPIDSIGGVASYQFLADQNRKIREKNNGKRPKKI